MALKHSSLAFVSAVRRQWGMLVLASAVALAAIGPVVLKAQDQRGFAQTAVSEGVAVNGNYYALVIGIDKYPAPLHQLKTAVNDAQSVGGLLHDRYGFQVQYLLDQNATRFNILNALGKLRATLNGNDSLLIYYGGHGYFDHDTDRAYWLPVDADSGTSPNTIMADDLTSLIRALPSRHVMIVSDSCYSGGLSRDADEPTRAGNSAALLNRELRSRSRTLMASGGNEPVSDSGANGHSVFANAILNALERTDEPMFTAIDLFYTSIRRQVAGKSAQLPEYSTIRNSNDDDGDFVFVRETVPAPARAAEPLTPEKGNALIAAGDYGSALPLFTSSCERGEAVGCSGLGVLYDNGLGVTKDETRAAGYFRKGCDGGRMPACQNLGVLYEAGNGIGKDEAQAASLYRKACNGDDAGGCTSLGQMYANGSGVDRDGLLASALYLRGCNGGDGRGCGFLGYLHENGADKDYVQAVSFYRKACDAGYQLGCSNLGAMYANGTGVAKDEAQAVSLYSKSCDAGYADGCTRLGAMYANGRGVAKDGGQAFTFYTRACDKGSADGCTNLGVMYGTGASVTKDQAQAVTLFRKACDGGSAMGCSDLGVLYEDGTGVAEDDAQAVTLFRRACDGGSANGCSDLGHLYENGKGIVADKSQAASLYKQGCDGGDDFGCRNLKRLKPDSK